MKKRQVYVIKDQGKGVVSGVTESKLFAVSDDSSVIVGGGTVETDPIFSASPSYTITNADKTLWSDKNYNNLTNKPNLSLKADLVAGKVPVSQSQSEVIERSNLAALNSLPASEKMASKIYVALDDNKIYRWSGSIFVEIAPSPLTNFYPKIEILSYDQDATNYVITIAVSQLTDFITVSNLTSSDLEVIIPTDGINPTSAVGISFNNNQLLGHSIYNNPAPFTLTGYALNILIPKASNTSLNWDNDETAITVVWKYTDKLDGFNSRVYKPRRFATDTKKIGEIRPKQISAGDLTAPKIEMFLRSSDFSGYVLLDGRPISSLTTSQQAVAIGFGFTSNIPDATNSVLMQNGNALGSVNGSNTKTIAVENLPTDAITTSNSGDHFHETGEEGRYYDNPDFKTIGGSILRHYAQNLNMNSVSTNAIKTSDGGIHSHSIQLNNGTQSDLDITPRSLSVNMFIYLGL